MLARLAHRECYRRTPRRVTGFSRGGPRRVDSVMQITVNGELQEAPAGETVASLVERLGLAGSACAAEVNRQLVPRAQHTQRELHEGDSIEIVTLVGGG